MNRQQQISRREYDKIHYWLRRTFGSATKCEDENCQKKSKTYQWALLKGKEYIKKRENFIQLCKSCHTKYDFTEESFKKMRDCWLTRKIYTVDCRLCPEKTQSVHDKPRICPACAKKRSVEVSKRKHQEWRQRDIEGYRKYWKRHYEKHREYYKLMFKKRAMRIKQEKNNHVKTTNIHK